jgi:hypothetical protein
MQMPASSDSFFVTLDIVGGHRQTFPVTACTVHLPSNESRTMVKRDIESLRAGAPLRDQIPPPNQV